MALDTYANLKASIKNWSHRNDLDDLIIDDFIDLAEQDMYHNSQAHLMIRCMEKRATADLRTDSRFIVLPTGFINMRRLKLNLAQGDNDIRFMAAHTRINSRVSTT